MSYQTAIRLPDELYQKIKETANEEERTVTGEIIYILKQYFKQQEK